MYIHIFVRNIKNMKNIVSTLFALALSVSVMAGGPKETSYKVDNDLSSLEWIGKKVSGAHNGSIKLKDGEILVENGMISTGTITIDMQTITVEDIKDAETNAKLKGHLMSPDFFGVEEHQTAVLKINSVSHKEGDTYIIHGDLTIKGITHPIEIPTTVKMEGKKLVAIGEANIDRTKYSIKYGSGKFFEGLGDRMIYDEFTVKFKVGAIQG